MLRLYRPEAGTIRYSGADVATLGDTGLRPFRRNPQMIFQDPLSSFNQSARIGKARALPLRLHRLCAPADIDGEAERAKCAWDFPPGSGLCCLGYRVRIAEVVRACFAEETPRHVRHAAA